MGGLGGKSGTPEPRPASGSDKAPESSETSAAKKAEAAKKYEAGKKDILDDKKRKRKDLLSNIRGSLNYLQGSGLAQTFELFVKRLQVLSDSIKLLGNYDFGELIYGYDGPLKKSMDQLESQMKKHVKKIPEGELATLSSKKEELDKEIANENAGAYMFRVLGFMPPSPPKDIDENAFLLQALLVKLKISDPKKKRTLIGRKEIYKGVNVPEKGYKGPVLKKNDPLFFMVKIKGVRMLVGGFYEGKANANKIKIRTVENGKIVHKTYNMRDAFFAFTAPGNTEDAEKAKKDKDKKANPKEKRS